MAAGDGIPEFVTPYNTDEFESMVSAVRAHALGLKGQAEVVGADLRRLLPRAQNASGRMAFSLDLRAAAWQIGRQFGQFAGAQNSAAAALTRALEIYHGNFTSPQGGSHGRTFRV